jgi:nicotinamide phosphoribosyltransferase
MQQNQTNAYKAVLSVLGSNPILKVDSYKLSHPFVYDDGITGMFSYVEARIKNETIVPFGTQMWAIKNLLTPITKENIDEAEAFATAHGEPFPREVWERVLNEFGGYFPVKIRIVPEGMRVPSLNIIASCECDIPGLFSLSSNLETNMQRGIWYPTTIASNDYKNWRAIRRYAAETADDLSLVPFSLHDFGARGVSSGETAEVGGAAHLVFFMGSDTIEGTRAVNHYYFEKMAAYSVPASEHTVQCSFGDKPWEQRRYLEKMIKTYAKPGGIVSIVIDGYNAYREAGQVCEMKDMIIETGAKIVLRPDSGDVKEVIPKLLEILESGFGTKVNSKGFKVLNNVGLLQGDGIEYSTMVELLELVTSLGFSSSNIVFGSGGGLLQKVNRDTYKFAQKASAIKVQGQWKPIFKDPVTDPGKKSKSGRLTLVRNISDGNFKTVNVDTELEKYLSEGWEDVMVTLYDGVNNPGELLYTTTLAEVRARAQV